MIPVLYAPEVDIEWVDVGSSSEEPIIEPETWTKHLLGYLPDAISCTHTEVRNGSYELEMEYPDSALNAERIAVDCIIQVASPDPYMDEEDFPMFRIYKVERSLTGALHVYARHISEMLSYIIAPKLRYDPQYSEGKIRSLGSLIDYIRISMAHDGSQLRPESIPFVIYSEGINPSEASFTMNIPASVRAYLGGGELPDPDRSALQIWGGEYEYRGWIIILHASRGKDEGYEIRYGKNISGITIDEDVDGVYTVLRGYYQGEDSVIWAHPYETSYRRAFPYDRTAPYDATSDFQDSVPTKQQIYTATRLYAERNNIGNPVRMVDVDLVQLEKTAEFKNYIGISDLLLCDTATLIYNRHGVNINAKMKVTELTYDVLNERTTNIKLGTIQRTMVSDMAKNTQWRANQQL